MELGRINVRGQNVNLLWQAIHPQHGLVWTTGNKILLEKVGITGGQVENNTPLKLGEFEHPLKSVHWSGNIGPTTCYLCVVHSQHVSIWKVDGLVPKLSFKQVRKLNVQPIPQGCLWNPERDILCVLSKQQCSFFFHHTQNKGSFAFPPLDSGTIKCGTWTTDGNKLVLCVGPSLFVYTWSRIDDSITNYSCITWSIPNFQRSVSSIIALSNNMVLCASELPLENLCKVKDTFVVPEISENTGSSSGEDIVTAKKSESLTDTLLNLQRNPQIDIESSTQLLTISLLNGQDPNTVSTTAVKGILCPEVLLFMPHLKSVVVGSNSQNTLQVFTFEEGDLTSNLVKTADIRLDKQERPKGISNFSPHPTIQNGVLITVGKRASSDSAFLSSSSGSVMEIKLKLYTADIDKSVLSNKRQNGMAAHDGTQKVSEETQVEISNRGGNEGFMENKRSTNVSEVDGNHVIYDRDLHLTKQETVTELKDFTDSDSSNSSPRDIIIGSQPKGDKPLIEDLSGSTKSENELETQTAEFTNTVPCFQNNIEENFQEKIENKVPYLENMDISTKDKPAEAFSMASSLDDSAVSMATSGISITSVVPDSSVLDRMQLEMDRLNHRIEELKLKVVHLTNLIQESTIITRYQSQSQPELMQIEYHYPESEMKKKSFLLDNGRLQYEAVKGAFNLATLEIFIDDEPCVVSPNIDGYIPIRFVPSTTLKITGNKKEGDNSIV